MREIKFRAKIKDPKYPRLATWLYGFISRNKKGEWFMDTLQEDYIKIEEKSIGEYTGLKDKNSKEIYEGDILKVWISCEQDPLYLVESIEELYLEFNRDDSYYRFTKCQVVGNRYENPELLGGAGG